MIRTRQAQASIGVVLFSGLVFMMAMTWNATAGGGDNGDNGIGKKLAATYTAQLEVPAFGVFIQALFQIHDDGTAIMVEEGDYGCDDPSGSAESPNMFSWKKTGDRQITLRGLGYSLDLDGCLDGVSRFTFVLNFNHDYQEGTGDPDQSFGENFSLESSILEDPNTDEDPDLTIGGIVMSLHRLNVASTDGDDDDDDDDDDD